MESVDSLLALVHFLTSPDFALPFGCLIAFHSNWNESSCDENANPTHAETLDANSG
jgi:hypothetical protein